MNGHQEEESLTTEEQTPSSALSATEPTQPELSNKKHKLKLILKKLPLWASVGLSTVVIAALIAVCFLLNNKIKDLNRQNRDLNVAIDGYKNAASKPEDLADIALKTVIDDSTVEPTPTPAPTTTKEENFGGKAVQVNSSNPKDANPTYTGGEYAPFWLLSKFALTIPDGTKMVRTTNLYTDGHLFTLDNEGYSSCSGEGIFMTIYSDVSKPGGIFRAHGSSATYSSSLGCGGADPLRIVYARYYAMSKASQYKYLEVVVDECKELDDKYKCKDGKVDAAKWRLYSGIVPTDAVELKVNEDTDGSTIMKQLYNREANAAQFYLDCTDDTYNHFNCTADDYKNSDYNAALKDANYIHIKNIVLGMHEH